MNILVTGTSQGIGLGIAKRFLADGHIVYGFDRKGCPVELCGDINYHHIIVDVRFPELFPELPQIDIIINNAGTQNEDDIEINLKGVINITEHYGIHEGIKSILNIGSASAHTGAEFPEYAASKGGILSYTKNVAMRIAKFGATCNSLDPGGVITDLNRPVLDDAEAWEEIMQVTPLKRWAEVSEIAEWAYFLCMVNKFCTAQNILVDGGEANYFNFVWR